MTALTVRLRDWLIRRTAMTPRTPQKLIHPAPGTGTPDESAGFPEDSTDL
jgi:hypothetical protein